MASPQRMVACGLTYQFVTTNISYMKLVMRMVRFAVSKRIYS